jgi:tetratricopeptide (TPR) repeat protein
MSLRIVFAALVLGAVARAASPLDEAIDLYKQKKYPDARTAFEKITAAEPKNAAACYYLGMTMTRRGDDKAREDALPWLEKAATLEPSNPTYLADYGGIAMLVADQRHSLSSLGLVRKGRDAMEKSLTIDPNNIEARVGLWRFYTEAPLGLGDDSKAALHLAEIRKQDPKRGALILIDAEIRLKKFGDAFKFCDELLAKTPDDFFALFQYARVSLASGQNLEPALVGLQKYVALASASPGKANPALAWIRMGNIHEKLGHVNEARSAYEAALRLQPDDSAAAAALAKLK